MPSPSQTRALRVRRLVAVARVLLEGGASPHLLFDKLNRVTFRLWPTLRDKTRREYVVSALKEVLSRPHTEFDLLTDTIEPIPQREGQ